MKDANTPREGDLYKTYRIEAHVFPIYYGYYEENERGRVEPLPIFPDLRNQPLYTAAGERIVTSLQAPCESYCPRYPSRKEDWCGDCMHYCGGRDEIGLCQRTGGEL